MSLLRIVPSIHFAHAGNLASWYSQHRRDPRSSDFEPTEVQIDLRKCEFVWPSAVVWCACYALLVRHRGRACELIVPEDLGVAIYLKSTGLFTILRETGVEIDDRDVGEASTSQTILPLSRFATVFDAEKLGNLALEHLSSQRFPGPQLAPVVSETFSELAGNAAQHAQSPIGGIGMIQFYDFREGQRFVITVGDGGIGIRKGLSNNPDLENKIHYDWTAIELATRERVSGTGDPYRGIGLYGVAEDARKGGRRLIIHSGIGVLQISEEIRQESHRTNPFPGTLALMGLQTKG